MANFPPQNEDDIRALEKMHAENDIVNCADRVMRYIEDMVICSKIEILKHCWRYVNAEALDVILRTFSQAGLIYTRQIDGKLYITSRVSEPRPKPKTSEATKG